MCRRVGGQVMFSTELASTNVTGKRFLPGMCPHMVLQVPATLERSMTDVAEKTHVGLKWYTRVCWHPWNPNMVVLEYCKLWTMWATTRIKPYNDKLFKIHFHLFVWINMQYGQSMSLEMLQQKVPDPDQTVSGRSRLILIYIFCLRQIYPSLAL